MTLECPTCRHYMSEREERLWGHCGPCEADVRYPDKCEHGIRGHCEICDSEDAEKWRALQRKVKSMLSFLKDKK